MALFGQRDIMLRVEFSVENIDFVKKSFVYLFLKSAVTNSDFGIVQMVL